MAEITKQVKKPKKKTEKKPASKIKNIVIVESPAKAKTIKKYLGPTFDVVASMGHIRDLPKSKLGVDIEQEFEPSYINIRGKAPLINELKKKAKQCENVYLAGDPDREGEAISFHLATILGLDLEEKNRVTFNEITKDAVKNGIKNPRNINMDLFDAQQARRILDRLVGYQLSPFLWVKVRKGLSAGRVQSVAVKIIVDRENEIRAFVSEEYWTVEILFKELDKQKKFIGKLATKQGKKLQILNESQAEEIVKDLEEISGSAVGFTIDSMKQTVKKRQPSPPFITSTMQQEASRRLGFQAQRTMRAAQELYEGIDIKGVGTVGLITYMRTDSLRISNEAQEEAKHFILEKYGAPYFPEVPRVYKSKSKTTAQDAHEAIRPSMSRLTPLEIKDSLSGDQFKLYKLIWERFMASQMSNALYDAVSVEIKGGEYGLKSSGLTVKFDGFTKLYEESSDTKEEKNKKLPAFTKDTKLEKETIDPQQHFTQPPPRYSEASLIKTMEENGIGRPSTYSPTITTILKRGYIKREAKTLLPTELGEVTTDLMKNHFEEIVDIEFSANMESDLDKIEEGEENWRKVLQRFYGKFKVTLEKADKEFEGIQFEMPVEETDIPCELCGKNMVIKMGRFGKFMACPGYPECKNTKAITKPTEGHCPLCDNIILEKKSKRGKVYFGCEKNPECGFMSWDTPLEEKCPTCGKSLLEKSGKNTKIYCSNEICDYQREAKK